MLALERKEDLQTAIEEQIEMGVRGLDEADKYLMENKLEDLETTRGESQAYCTRQLKLRYPSFVLSLNLSQSLNLS